MYYKDWGIRVGAPATHTHEGREKRGGGRDGQSGVAHMDGKRK